ncbi:MAG: hypothetical protein IJA78_00725 [Clostridia bacterium]|nr:hypothetical protein [Clostridia bacterium]MBQ3482682.1 hypothetical protein [Clostridia bacterium]
MENELKTNKNSAKVSLLTLVLAFVCFLTNISQHPELVDAGATQFLAIPAWILLALFLAMARSFSLHRDVIVVLSCALVFSVMLALYTIFFEHPYFESATTYSFYLSVFVFLIGALCARYVTKEVLRHVALVYVISALAVALAIYIQFFVGNEDVFAELYVYRSKNSFAQIVLVAIVLLLTVIRPKGRILVLLKYICAAFLIYLLFILRSRATIVSFAVVTLLILLLQRRFQPSAKERHILLVAVLVLAAFLIFHAEFRSIFVDGILLVSRENESLDAISSGRLSLLHDYWPLLCENYGVGIGDFYLDCFPFATLIQFGIFASIPLFAVALYPLVRACRRSVYGEDWRFVLLLIAAAYLANSLFECLPPFGPGVKCYFLWLLLGIVVGGGKPDRSRV